MVKIFFITALSCVASMAWAQTYKLTEMSKETFLKYIMAEAGKQDAYVDPTQPDPNPVAEIPGYVYQWGDEFNYEGAPDGDLWQMETGFVRGQEEQYYQKDNALVTGGRLLITGKKERVLNADYDPSSGDWRKNRQYGEYTSSSLLGKNRRHFLYGHIEVRAKLDISNGAFPAIWTCGYNKDWPQNGEIDIMEYYKTGNNYVLTSNFCVGGDQTGADGKWAQKWKSVFTNRDYYLAKDPDWFSKYHIFSMDWDEKTISLKVDGEERNSCDIESFLNWDGSVCFNNPQFMMLNLAIKNFGDGIADKITFEVDYFRVYQKVRDIETPTEVKNLKAVRVTATTATIAWEPASDDTGILRYDIYCGGKSDGYYRGSTTSTSFTLTGLKQKTLHQIYVRALDGVGNHSSATQVNVLTKSTVGFDRVDYKEGERLFYNGKTYVVGRNLIENNSFDNGFASWYDGTNKAELSSKGWKINSDGGVDGNWLQSLGNTGKTGLSSLSTAWEISPDSIYLFGFYASAQSTINDAAKWQCVSATDAKGVETTMLLGPNGANGQLALTNGDDSWRYTSIVYDNTLNRHKYLQCCFRWEQMGAIGFDCFQLCPLIEDVALGVSAVHDDGDVSGQSVIYNISGQRVCKDKISSGIYIINGKKTVIK